MRKTNKIISLVLSLLLILSIIPVTVSAVEYSGTCGKNLTWHLDDATGVLTISGTGDMRNYNSITTFPEWKALKPDIVSVCIEEGVTSIGNCAFRACDALENVQIPDSVTKIGSSAFQNCSSLENVQIPDSVTEIGSSAFEGDYGIPKITIGTSVVKIGWSAIPKTVPIFYKGTLEEWYKVEENSKNSYSASGYYSVHCSDADFYPRGVYSDSITWEFNDITGILSFSGTGDMVGYEDASESIDAPYKGYVGRAKKIVLSEGITSIGNYEFYDISSMTIVIPSSVTTISSTAFYRYGSMYCIAEVYYGGTIAQWKEIESTFDYWYDDDLVVHCVDGDMPIKGTCGENLVWQFDSGTGVLTISGSGAMDDYHGNYDDRAPWVKYVGLIKSVIIEEGVETIGEYAFYCIAPKVVSIPETVKTISDYAFYYCGTTEISIPEGVTTIGQYALTGVENITIPESVTKIGMYNFVDSTTIHYAGTKKQWQTLEKEHKGLFTSYHRVYCSDGELLPSGVCGENATWVFDDATGILTISGSGNIDDSEYSENGSAYFDQPWMFYQNDIKVVNVEEGITSICARAFDGLFNLQSATLPSTLKIIGSYAFWACLSLSNVVIPDGVTYIDSNAFQNCPTLKSITIPVSVTSVGKYAFGGNNVGTNSAIEDIYYMGSMDQWYAIENVTYGLDDTKVHYNSKITEYAGTCTKPGYIEYTCDSCGVCKTEKIEATGHKYIGTTFEATCTKHGYTKYTCDECGHYYNDYTANPTGHKINADGVCESCGKTEVVNTTASNNQLLSFDSILQLIMNLMNKIFDAILVV